MKNILTEFSCQRKENILLIHDANMRGKMKNRHKTREVIDRHCQVIKSILYFILQQIIQKLNGDGLTDGGGQSSKYFF